MTVDVERFGRGLSLARDPGRLRRISATRWIIFADDVTLPWYDVDTVAGTCTCPDFSGRPIEKCKHLYAVEAIRFCERCGSTWVPVTSSPKRCARCGSKHWNNPPPTGVLRRNRRR